MFKFFSFQNCFTFFLIYFCFNFVKYLCFNVYIPHHLHFLFSSKWGVFPFKTNSINCCFPLEHCFIVFCLCILSLFFKEILPFKTFLCLSLFLQRYPNKFQWQQKMILPWPWTTLYTCQTITQFIQTGLQISLLVFPYLSCHHPIEIWLVTRLFF